jgi:hypothetical protein
VGYQSFSDVIQHDRYPERCGCLERGSIPFAQWEVARENFAFWFSIRGPLLRERHLLLFLVMWRIRESCSPLIQPPVRLDH